MKNSTQKVGSELIWLWIDTIESEIKKIYEIRKSKERNMIVAERFLSNVIKEYGEHTVSTDMEVLCCMILIINDFTIYFG